jgi:enoyl-CoA hydratase/carnithine racemase
MSNYQDLEIRHEKSVSWIYLNRPGVMNAMSFNTIRELRQAYIELEQRAETRVVILSGRGRAFCAGADLRNTLPASSGPSPQPTFLDEATAMENALLSITKPVIAAVNGVCCAGGLEIALMCDFIVASEDAKLGDAHANFGAMPGGGTTARLARLVGGNMAKYIFFSGKLFPAGELYQAGLVTVLAAADQLEAKVQELAEGIASKSPLGLRHMKALINDAHDVPLKSAVKMEKLVSATYMQSFDASEGGRAFAEKKTPVFKGY